MDLSACIRAGASVRREVMGLGGLIDQLRPRSAAASLRAREPLWGDGFGQNTFEPAQVQCVASAQIANRLSQALRLVEEARVLSSFLRDSIESGDSAETIPGDVRLVTSGSGQGLVVTLEPSAPQTGPSLFAYASNPSGFVGRKRPSDPAYTQIGSSQEIINGTTAVIPSSPQLTGDDRGAVTVGSDPHRECPMEVSVDGTTLAQALQEFITKLKKEGKWPEDREAQLNLCRWFTGGYVFNEESKEAQAPVPSVQSTYQLVVPPHVDGNTGPHTGSSQVRGSARKARHNAPRVKA